MKALWTILVASLALAAAPQQATQPASQPDPKQDINYQIAKLDALNHVLPLLLTKDQANKILTALEKVREKERQVRKMEDDQLKPFRERIAKAIEDGEKKKLVPDRQLLADLAKLLGAFDRVRAATAEDNVSMIEETLKSTLNAGQLKTLAKSLDPRFFAPDLKIEEITDSERIRIFIRAILLQPATYDLLVELAKNS
ncbi:MAG TPA: hypothetical protein DER07_10675 [Armatimonadetes bacterium]|jgi:hypothetical protein|nr:hypothetical protein [Armatimonadota bacterium]MCA1997931.1 hypothetical protein [Armatimonadota bacterium]HCE01492.1 hypothetical protein [Armatimonadota bacterium]